MVPGRQKERERRSGSASIGIFQIRFSSTCLAEFRTRFNLTGWWSGLQCKEVFQGMSRGKVEGIYVSAVDSSKNYLRHGIEFSLWHNWNLHTKKGRPFRTFFSFLIIFSFSSAACNQKVILSPVHSDSYSPSNALNP